MLSILFPHIFITSFHSNFHSFSYYNNWCSFFSFVVRSFYFPCQIVHLRLGTGADINHAFFSSSNTSINHFLVFTLSDNLSNSGRDGSGGGGGGRSGEWRFGDCGGTTFPLFFNIQELKLYCALQCSL